MSTSITHWDDGAAFAGESDLWADVTNPATGRVSGRVALASRADADHVIAAATKAAPAWGVARTPDAGDLRLP